jgi:hypothetical protein
MVLEGRNQPLDGRRRWPWGEGGSGIRSRRVQRDAETSPGVYSQSVLPYVADRREEVDKQSSSSF